MQAINHVTTNLEVQLQKLITASEIGGGQLTVAITNAQNLLNETKSITKTLNYNLLNEFLNANALVLGQLNHVSQTLDPTNPIMVKSSDVMLQLTHMYQDAIVPLLTRLHNLSDETDNMQRITAITSLGNEINTCSGQINQFNDKFSVNEKTYTMFGVILMLSSISMMVALISKPSIEIPLVTPLTIMTLGCGICKKAMETHIQDPGSDLITTSIKKIEPLIYDVATDFAQEEHPQQKVIMQAKGATKKAKATPKSKAAKTSTEDQDIQEESITEVSPKKAPSKANNLDASPTQGTILEKIKGVLDIFTTRK